MSLCLPDGFVKTFPAAVKMVRAVIGCEVVFLAIEMKLAVSNAAGTAANRATKVGAVVIHIVIECIEAEDDVGESSIAVRRQ